jgi:predicted metal-dependent RNase
MKGIQVGKEIIKISLFADNMILYLKDPKNFTQETINHVSNVAKKLIFKIIFWKSVTFLNNNKQIEEEYMKTIPFIIASKKSNT